MAEERIPYLCPHEGCGFIGKNIVGWKRHMTMTHQGYDDEQVNAALPAVPVPEFTSQGADVGAGVAPSQASPSGEARERRPRRTQVQKEFDDQVNKFISMIVETILHYSAEKQAQMEAARGEMLSAVLGVHCEFEAGMITLRSVWWLVLLILSSYFTPTIALLGKSMKEKAASRAGKKEREKEPEGNVDESRIQ